MRTLIAIILLLCFILNGPVLMSLYNTADYYGYVAFVDMRSRVYECMFCIFFLCIYLGNSRGSMAVAAAGFTLAFSSVVDKCLLNLHHYLLTDILIVTLALVVGIKVYINSKVIGKVK